MIAAVAAPVEVHPLPGGVGELAEHLRRDGLVCCAFKHRLCPQGIGLGLIPSRLEAGDAILERRIVQIGHTGLNGIVKPLQAQLGLGRSLVQFGDMLAAALGMSLPAVDDRGQNLLQPFGRKQPILDVAGDQFRLLGDGLLSILEGVA